MRSHLSVFRRGFAGGKWKITSRQAVADERANGVRTACGDVRKAEFMRQVRASVHVLFSYPFLIGPRWAALFSPIVYPVSWQSKDARGEFLLTAR